MTLALVCMVRTASALMPIRLRGEGHQDSTWWRLTPTKRLLGDKKLVCFLAYKEG